MSGGTNTTPAWTLVDGSQAVCGTCHGLPPLDPHTPADDCERCHSTVVASFDAVNPSNTVWSDATLHVDGQVQFD